MGEVKEARGGYGGIGGGFTSTGAILVLFILLVIISRTILF
ncbi:YjcZ family sporulation protein [Paenibacillus sp. SN-8-1]